MCARLVTTHMKPGRFDKATDRLAKDVIPLLKKQAGFRDELSFFDDTKDDENWPRDDRNHVRASICSNHKLGIFNF